MWLQKVRDHPQHTQFCFAKIKAGRFCGTCPPFLTKTFKAPAGGCFLNEVPEGYALFLDAAGTQPREDGRAPAGDDTVYMIPTDS